MWTATAPPAPCCGAACRGGEAALGDGGGGGGGSEEGRGGGEGGGEEGGGEPPASRALALSHLTRGSAPSSPTRVRLRQLQLQPRGEEEGEEEEDDLPPAFAEPTEERLQLFLPRKPGEKVVDPFGAADAFFASYVAARCRHLSPAQALTWAYAGGSISNSRPGAVDSMPDLQEVTAFLDAELPSLAAAGALAEPISHPRRHGVLSSAKQGPAAPAVPASPGGSSDPGPRRAVAEGPLASSQRRAATPAELCGDSSLHQLAHFLSPERYLGQNALHKAALAASLSAVVSCLKPAPIGSHALSPARRRAGAREAHGLAAFRQQIVEADAFGWSPIQRAHECLRLTVSREQARAQRHVGGSQAPRFKALLRLLVCARIVLAATEECDDGLPAMRFPRRFTCGASGRISSRTESVPRRSSRGSSLGRCTGSVGEGGVGEGGAGGDQCGSPSLDDKLSLDERLGNAPPVRLPTRSSSSGPVLGGGSRGPSSPRLSFGGDMLRAAARSSRRAAPPLDRHSPQKAGGAGKGTGGESAARRCEQAPFARGGRAAERRGDPLLWRRPRAAGRGAALLPAPVHSLGQAGERASHERCLQRGRRCHAGAKQRRGARIG